jgi:hypothetical protein
MLEMAILVQSFSPKLREPPLRKRKEVINRQEGE